MNFNILVFFLLISLGRSISIFSQNNETNTFIELLKTNNFPEAHHLFDTTLQKNFSEAKLKDTWGSISKSLGTLKSYKPNCDKTIDGFQVKFITCEFEKQTLDLKLVLNEIKEIVGFFIVPVTQCDDKKGYKIPKYADISSYKEEKISIEHDTISLNGTLTIPNSTTQSICIFIHGSGPNDRDESIGPNKPFKDIALGLASKGIASIRFDKRTFTYKNMSANITIKEEVVDDVLSVIDYISNNKDLKGKNFYLIGHSLGGMLLPKIVEQRPNVKGGIFLAANARSLEDLILIQSNFLANLDGIISPEENQELTKLKGQVEYLKDSISTVSPSDKLPLNVPAPYWISLKNYNQLETVKRLSIPMYFLQGKRDYQVTTEDLNLWEASLITNKNAKFKIYPKLNHLFLEGKSKPNPNEYNEPSNVPLYIIEDISKWINSNQ